MTIKMKSLGVNPVNVSYWKSVDNSNQGSTRWKQNEYTVLDLVLIKVNHEWKL